MNPTVTITEHDSSFYQNESSSDVAAFVGMFEKGPIDYPIFCDTPLMFKQYFGRATKYNANDWYQVYNYLQYTSGIWVIRTSSDMMYNASTLKNDVFVDIVKSRLEKEEIVFEQDKDENFIDIVSLTPGEAGNLLTVEVIHSFNKNAKNYSTYFPFFEDGYIGLVVKRNNKVVETFYKSYDEVLDINNESNYIFIRLFDVMNDENVLLLEDTLKLTGGLTGNPRDEHLKTSYSILEDTTNINIDIIIANDRNNNLAIECANNRKDCIVFCGLPPKILYFLEVLLFGDTKIFLTDNRNEVLVRQKMLGMNKVSDVYDEIKTYINDLVLSDFCHFTINCKKQKNNFTGKYDYFNIAGDIAGLKAKASNINKWTPNAGLVNGVIKNFERIVSINDPLLTKDLYSKNINYVENNVLMTQKLFNDKQSSQNRVNIRSLVNYLEKSISSNIRKYIFDLNTVHTRNIIMNEAKQILIDAKTNRGIENGKVVVKPDGIDQIIVEIYIKPIYVAEFIKLTFTNVGTNTITNIQTRN